jgi:UV DNA damage endonuclease
MQPVLGLVCQTTGEEVRFHTLTRTRLQKLDDESQRATLRELYRANMQRLGRGFAYCKQHGISLFRMTSDLFPFADTDLGEAVLRELTPELARLGQSAAGLRLVMHPDQYVVLSSERPEVVDNARRVLQMHGLIMDLLGQPRTPWASLIIHGGKAGRGAPLAEQVRRLPEPVRTRLVLENDERAYGTAEILKVCKDSEVPMVFDAHHHLVHDRLTSYDDPSVRKALTQARGTWPEAAWQLTHISNGRESFGDMRHSDFITTMPACYREAPFIEVEAKAKEQAIARLRDLGW